MLNLRIMKRWKRWSALMALSHGWVLRARAERSVSYATRVFSYILTNYDPASAFRSLDHGKLTVNSLAIDSCSSGCRWCKSRDWLGHDFPKEVSDQRRFDVTPVLAPIILGKDQPAILHKSQETSWPAFSTEMGYQPSTSYCPQLCGAFESGSMKLDEEGSWQSLSGRQREIFCPGRDDHAREILGLMYCDVFDGTLVPEHYFKVEIEILFPGALQGIVRAK
jgi:hypothetical protein